MERGAPLPWAFSFSFFDPADNHSLLTGGTPGEEASDTRTGVQNPAFQITQKGGGERQPGKGGGLEGTPSACLPGRRGTGDVPTVVSAAPPSLHVLVLGE